MRAPHRTCPLVLPPHAAPLPDCASLPNTRFCMYCDRAGALTTCLGQGGVTCQARHGCWRLRPAQRTHPPHTLTSAALSCAQAGGRTYKPCTEFAQSSFGPVAPNGCYTHLMGGQVMDAHFRGVLPTPPSEQDFDCRATSELGLACCRGRHFNQRGCARCVAACTSSAHGPMGSQPRSNCPPPPLQCRHHRRPPGQWQH